MNQINQEDDTRYKSLVQFNLRRMLSMPLRILIKRTIVKIWDQIKKYNNRNRDQRQMSFMLQRLEPCKPLTDLLGNLPQDISKGDWNWLKDVSQYYFSHRFDLLGSGWVCVYHGMCCRGLENHRFNSRETIKANREGHWLEGRINLANLVEAKRIWNLVDVNYCPIDWHLDFKSGYRWREDTWYKDIKYGHVMGVDVKVPWELARMQHLPQLAWAYALANKGRQGFNQPDRYAREFRNQILDFMATNPPRWGVNWACTMDVAIRISNWLVAYDLFKSFGAQFDPEFESLFFRSVYEHGRHITENLEWTPVLRSNHYLSDIVGLLFVSVYLPCSTEINAWLAFSVQELVKEVKNQFYEDGANFEASTSYHRLSAELVVYATTLVLGLSVEKQQALQTYEHGIIKGTPGLDPSPLPLYPLPNSSVESPFPEWYFLRLERMAEFTMHITKPGGHIPQFGDNDSGRFLKLFPAYERMTVGQAKACYKNLADYTELADEEIYWMEDILDHQHLITAFHGLFPRADFCAYAGCESEVIAALSRNTKIVMNHAPGKTTAAQGRLIGDSHDLERCEKLYSDNQYRAVVTRFPAGGASLRDGLETYAYPDFGLYLFRSKRLYLAIRCGPVGQNGNGGHAHNDQLAIELEIDGKPVIIDPGTYNYTALPDRRNAYRSVKAHFAPRMRDEEPGDLTMGAFVIVGDPQAKVIYFGQPGFMGMHKGYGSPVYRKIAIEDSAVVVTDFAPGYELSQHTYEKIAFSPAYGVINIMRNGNEKDN
jgi:hypothetical protein